MFINNRLIKHWLRHAEHSDADLLQHQVLVCDLDLSSNTESGNTLHVAGRDGLLPSSPVLMDGFVSLHTVCSLILPSDHNGGRIRGDSIADSKKNARTSQPDRARRAARRYDRAWMTLCVSAQVTSCENDRGSKSSTTSAQVCQTVEIRGM